MTTKDRLPQLKAVSLQHLLLILIIDKLFI
jgi:hypothetical protein